MSLVSLYGRCAELHSSYDRYYTPAHIISGVRCWNLRGPAYPCGFGGVVLQKPLRSSRSQLAAWNRPSAITCCCCAGRPGKVAASTRCGGKSASGQPNMPSTSSKLPSVSSCSDMASCNRAGRYRSESLRVAGKRRIVEDLECILMILKSPYSTAAAT